MENCTNIWTRIPVQWPSGLRRLTQVQVSSEAWVRIPPEPVYRNFCSSYLKSKLKFCDAVVDLWRVPWRNSCPFEELSSKLQKKICLEWGSNPRLQRRIELKSTALDHSAIEAFTVSEFHEKSTIQKDCNWWRKCKFYFQCQSIKIFNQ